MALLTLSCLLRLTLMGSQGARPAWEKRRPMSELEQRTVMRELLKANYAGEPFTFPSGYLFAPQLMGAQLDKVTMDDLKMPSADLRFCSMTDARLNRVDLSSSQGQELGWSRSVLSKVSLYRSFLSRAVIRETVLRDCHLERCFLDRVAGRGSQWLECYGDGAVFDNSQMEGGFFRGYRTRATSFTEANLEGAQSSQCSFVKVDFSMAILKGTKFEECSFEECNFSGAFAHGLVFRDCSFENTYLSPRLLNNATLESTGG